MSTFMIAVNCATYMAHSTMIVTNCAGEKNLVACRILAPHKRLYSYSYDV